MWFTLVQGHKTGEWSVVLVFSQDILVAEFMAASSDLYFLSLNITWKTPSSIHLRISVIQRQSLQRRDESG